MKGKNKRFLRIVKSVKSSNKVEDDDLNQKLRDVYQEMEKIIDLIDSNVHEDGDLPSLAK